MLAKIIDTAEIISKHPEVAKKSVNAVLTIVGAFFPVALIGKTFVADLPEETFSKIIGILSLGDPVHMAHAMTDYAGKKTIQYSAEIPLDGYGLSEKELDAVKRYRSSSVYMADSQEFPHTHASCSMNNHRGKTRVLPSGDSGGYNASE